MTSKSTTMTSKSWQLSSSSEDELPPFSCPSKRPKTETNKIFPAVILSDSSDEDVVYVPLSKRIRESPLREKSVNNSDINTCLPVTKSVKLDYKNIELTHPKKSLLKINKIRTNSTIDKVSKNQESEMSKKAQKQAEVLKRKAAQAELKSLKPEECLKTMTCLIDASIPAMFEKEALISMLREDPEPTYRETCFGNTFIKWQRKVKMHTANSVTNSLDLYTDMQDETDIITVLQVNNFIALISQENRGLTNWASRLFQQHTNCAIHAVCIGLEKYKRQVKNKAEREYKKQVREIGGELLPSNPPKKKKNNKNKDISVDEIENSLVECQLSTGMNFLFVENCKEVVMLTQQMTKAIAEAPYKRMKRKNIQFINETSSVKVDAKTGNGSTIVWRQMLLQLHNVSPEMAEAITTNYPTMESLIKTYERMNSCQGMALLSDIVVRRGVGTLQSKRRVGPELSKRVYKMFTSVEGDKVLF